MMALISSPRVIAAAAVLLFLGVIYGKGRLDAAHAQKAARLTQHIEHLEKSLVKAKNLRQADALVQLADSHKMTSLSAQIKDANEKLKDGDRQCFSADDTDLLRQLWKVPS